MARGNEAKQEVIQRIAEAFGADWIGEVDKLKFLDKKMDKIFQFSYLKI